MGLLYFFFFTVWMVICVLTEWVACHNQCSSNDCMFLRWPWPRRFLSLPHFHTRFYVVNGWARQNWWTGNNFQETFFFWCFVKRLWRLIIYNFRPREWYHKILMIPALVFIYRLRNKLRFICLRLKIRKLDKRYCFYIFLNCCPTVVIRTDVTRKGGLKIIAMSVFVFTLRRQIRLNLCKPDRQRTCDVRLRCVADGFVCDKV